MLLTDLPSCAMLEPVFVETTNCDMHTTEAQNTEPQRTGYRLGEKDAEEKSNLTTCMYDLCWKYMNASLLSNVAVP